MSKTQLMLVLLAGCLVVTATARADSIHFREGGGSGYTDVTFDDTFIVYNPADDTTHGNQNYDGIQCGSSRVTLVAIKDLFTQLPASSGGADIQINSATLHLFRYNSGSSSNTISVYPVTTDWLPDSAGANENDVSGEHSEKSSTTDWASGDWSSSDYDSSTCSTGSWVNNYNEECELDVTDVIAEIYDDEVNYGMVLYADGSISGRASEHSTYRPTLEITYEYVSGTTYTLTVNSGSGDGNYAESAVVDITADTAPSGYVFDDWVGDTSNIADVDDPTTTITMPAADAEITATYGAATLYTLTVNSGTGDGSYQEDWVVDINADSPASGKQFDEWVGDTSGIASVSSSSTTLTMPAANQEVTATYEDAPAGTTQLIVDWGDSENNNVYDFSDWADPYLGLYTSYSSLGPDGIKAGWTGTAMSGAVDGSSETFSEDDQIKVTWYNANASSLTIYPKISFDDPDGYGSGTSGTWYDLGQLVCPGESSGTTTYTFTSGTEGDYSLVNVCRYTTGDVQDMLIDKVELVTEGGGGPTYTLTVNSGTGDGSYSASQVVDITADSAPSGYVFDDWVGDTSTIADVDDPTTTITMPAADAEITAAYEAATTYSLTVNSGSGDGNYVESAVVDITADAAPSGYVFDDWVGDTSGIADVGDPTTTITMPASNAEITATYEAATLYTLTVNSGTGDGSYQESYVAGISADSPASGKQFDEWVGDTSGIANVNASSTTLTMPGGNAEITATYEDIPAGSGPSISSTSGTWSHGNSVTISGSSFGSKPTAAPTIWDDFEGGTDGEGIDGEGPVVGPDWDTFCSSGALPAYSDVDNRTNSSLCSMHDLTTGQYNCSLEYYGQHLTVYFTFWWKYDFYSGEYSDNCKPWIVYGTGDNYPCAYAGMSGSSGVLRSNIIDSPPVSGSTIWGNTTLSEIDGDWVRWEVFLEQSTPNESDGTYRLWTHKPYASTPDISLELDSGEGERMTRTGSDVYRQWHFGSYHCTDERSPDARTHIYIDDFYFDTTRARVEIGNASTWSGCTQREIQRPTSWSSSSITIVANKGSFSSFSGKYVYVVDSDGNVNSNGYACD